MYRDNVEEINRLRKKPFNTEGKRIETAQWGICRVIRSWLDVLDQEHVILESESDKSQHEVTIKGIKIGEDWIK